MHEEGGHHAVPVTFLVDDVHGGGGVARTVANVANHLAETHPVRIISYRRRRRRERFPLHPSIQVTALQGSWERSGRQEPREPGGLPRRLDRVPSLLRPRPGRMTLYTDLLLWRAVRSVRSGVLIATRPALMLAASRFARRGVATVGWDHLNLRDRSRIGGQSEVIRSARRRLSDYVVLTRGDAVDHSRAMPELPTPTIIHNSFSWPVAPVPAQVDSKVLVYAGRLAKGKGLGRLVRTFAEAAAGRPDWQLHIYGSGEKRQPISELVRRLGVEDQVKIMGYTHDLRGVLTRASAFAMASRSEGFPMVLIEAMSVGLPLVAFDCPRGPGEIVSNGRNGFLVSDGDLPGYSAALACLMDDVALRRRLGAQALLDAEQYTIGRIAADWERLFDQVTGVDAGFARVPAAG
jgi:glycosyltransferase involved in cell wall biosynthesis